MSKRPVVVYGASGYTGRLVAEYLRELNVPFTAAGRNAERVKEVIDAVGGIETIAHDCVGVDHDAASLTEAVDVAGAPTVTVRAASPNTRSRVVELRPSATTTRSKCSRVPSANATVTPSSGRSSRPTT